MPTTAGIDIETRHMAHLLRRATWGGSPDDVLQAARNGQETTVTDLVFGSDTGGTAPAPPPEAVSDTRRFDPSGLAAWWLSQMLTTPRPFAEKMTLFWHGHFATGNAKVHSPALMYRQNDLFRRMGLGRFDDLLSAVYKDPAMLIWLDGRTNTKVAPNENWGREVMELFTLGHGNYTEDDVHASARAFTGWRLDLQAPDPQPYFVPRLHDDGPKTLLGQTGNWDGEDAVRILSAHPATGPFLATKFWRFFASDSPPAAAIAAMAHAYESNDHSIAAMLVTLFTHPEFYTPETMTGHIKSPVDFLITALKALGLTGYDTTLLPRVLTLLGQTLFDPPNVGGWPGGPTWINAATMVERFNVASRLVGDAGLAGAVDADALLQASDAGDMSGLVFYVADLLGADLSAPTRAALLRYAGRGSIDSGDANATLRGLIHLVMVSPDYQVS